MATSEAARLGYESTRAERWSFCAYSFGQIVIYTIVSTYVQLYMTDIGITAAATGVILLVARIWDGVNDPIFGVIVNRMNLGAGKYRPWLNTSAPLIALFTIGIFIVPSSLDVVAKTALVAVMYLLWDLSYTMCDIPYFSITTVMTGDVAERNAIISRGRIFTGLGAVFVVGLFPKLYPKIGWPMAVGIMALVGFAGMFFLGRVSVERHRPPADESPSLGELLRIVVGNRYLMVLCAAAVITSVCNFVTVVLPYFAIHVLGGEQMLSLVQLTSLGTMLVFIVFAPTLIRKVDKFYVLLGSLVVWALMSLVMYLVGYDDLVLFLVVASIRTAAAGFPGTFLVLFIVDCAEYARFVSGEDATAATVSIQTVTNKINGALASGFAMLILGFAGFIEGEGAVQSPEVLRLIWHLMSWLPAPGAILAAALLWFKYRLRDSDIQLMSLANQGQLTPDEARSGFSPGVRA
ncbi:MAG: MFS transporter [Propionibacteriaceae bacterium]|jgi:probable glucitol transport protein GutA|nr:MFS transporter [Propionibacteriaceae bacterium]